MMSADELNLVEVFHLECIGSPPGSWTFFQALKDALSLIGTFCEGTIDFPGISFRLQHQQPTYCALDA